MSAILMRSLSKTYGSKRGVTDLSLEVRRGEIFGFIGPNGAGKSTTIRMILQLISPTSGELTVLGKPVRGDDPELRGRIGYLPSEIRLYPDMTGKQALELAAAVHGVDWKSSPVMDYAERLQWDMKPKIKSYSLGNRKKLGILLALLHDPELLVLDEPTSGLDPLVQQRFFEILKELSEKKGTTVFFSTHVLSEVEKLCRRVAFIKEGRLIQVSQLSELAADGWHRVEVAFAEPGDRRNAFGIFVLDPDAEYEGTLHRFRVKDDKLKDALTLLSGKPVSDVNIRRPSLEERFMDEYRSQPNGKEEVTKR